MSKRYTVEELWEMYEKKVEECQLAATIGQMLVQENEALKEQLQQQTLMPFPPAAEELDYRDRSSMQDSNLQNEIQQTLIQQSRQLKLRLEEEYQARITAESELQKQIDENDSLVSKNNQLRKKNGIGYF
jgi:translation initiation factor 2 beta subunit (eIF-2beta)/eIF-5